MENIQIAKIHVPDVAPLEDPKRTLRNVDLFLRHGAVLVRSLVRGRAIFSLCGSGIERSVSSRMEAIVQSLAGTCGVGASLAYDGLTVRLRTLKRR